MTKIGIGLYGTNGHQIHRLLHAHPDAELVAVAGIAAEYLPPELRHVRFYEQLEELCQDSRVHLISLCSPRRSDQANDACTCLESGKHVYAEKPCALTEADMDRILVTAEKTGYHFREMADTAFEQPYVAMKQVVDSGILGPIIQVFAQKSYPYHERRPQDESVDGGLTTQVGVHALRMIEHVAGQPIVTLQAFETCLGNPLPEGELRMATSLIARLQNSGVASVLLNYLNPKGMGRWGNEHLRIFGTNGFVETTDGGTKTRLVIGDTDRGPLDITPPVTCYLDHYLSFLQHGTPMPLTSAEELHPTRMTIRARQNARRENRS